MNNRTFQHIGRTFIVTVFLITSELAACPLPEKEILVLLMQHHDVSLNVDSSCENAGTEKKDKTVGEFISGFWVYHREETGKNWIKVQSKPIGKNHCEAIIEIYREDGEEIIGGWGVSFVVDNSKHKVDRASFRCRGSG